ncbi:MAG TPA: hypothetical protein VG755_32425 [Nannocystaceae bacterium]|nr:hypothetical protein [Nannocystaceae bacterium]
MGRWLLVMLVGCGYTSQYVPPDGARVRPVWIGRAIVPVGAREIPACEGEWEATPAPWVAEPTFLDRSPPLWNAFASPGLPVRERDEDDDDGNAVVGAVGAVVAATAIASAAVALAIAPVGETRKNALTIDAINQFNDDLRDPERCQEAP